MARQNLLVDSLYKTGLNSQGQYVSASQQAYNAAKTVRDQTLPGAQKPTPANPAVLVPATGAATKPKPYSSTVTLGENTATVTPPKQPTSAQVTMPQQPQTQVGGQTGRMYTADMPKAGYEFRYDPVTGARSQVPSSMGAKVGVDNVMTPNAPTQNPNQTLIADSRKKAVQGLMAQGITDPNQIANILNESAKASGYAAGDFTANEAAGYLGGQNQPLDVNDPVALLNAQQQFVQDQGNQQIDFYRGMTEEQDRMFADRQAKAQTEYDAQKITEQERKDKALADYKASQAAELATGTQAINQAGDQRTEQASLSLAFEGFGRSTKAAEIRDSISQDTQSQIAQLNRESSRAVNEYEASLLDNMNSRLKVYQDRVDKYGDARDEAKLKAMEGEQTLVMDILKANPLNPQNILDTVTKMTNIKINLSQEDREGKKAMQDRAKEVLANAVKYGYLPQGLTQDEKKTLASNLGVPTSALNKTIKMMSEKGDPVNQQVHYEEDRSGNITAVVFNPVTGKFETQNLGKFGKGSAASGGGGGLGIGLGGGATGNTLLDEAVNDYVLKIEAGKTNILDVPKNLRSAVQAAYNKRKQLGQEISGMDSSISPGLAIGYGLDNKYMNEHKTGFDASIAQSLSQGMAAGGTREQAVQSLIDAGYNPSSYSAVLKSLYGY